MGGPASYSDDHIEHVHQRLHITADEFRAMTETLRETLEDFDFDAADVEAVELQLRRRESLIVSVR
jgi:hemoglobin